MTRIAFARYNVIVGREIALVVSCPIQSAVLFSALCWKQWRHPPVRGEKSAQACSHNLPLQLLWHPPLPLLLMVATW